jgi:hypothetical protein
VDRTRCHHRRDGRDLVLATEEVAATGEARAMPLERTGWTPRGRGPKIAMLVAFAIVFAFLAIRQFA